MILWNIPPVKFYILSNVLCSLNPNFFVKYIYEGAYNNNINQWIQYCDRICNDSQRNTRYLNIIATIRQANLYIRWYYVKILRKSRNIINVKWWIENWECKDPKMVGTFQLSLVERYTKLYTFITVQLLSLLLKIAVKIHRPLTHTCRSGASYSVAGEGSKMSSFTCHVKNDLQRF